MPKEVMPIVNFKKIQFLVLGRARIDNGQVILSDDRYHLLNRRINKSGEYAVIRHELQHIKQAYSAIRFMGAEEFYKIAQEISVKPNLDLYKKIEKVMGRITPEDKDYKFAKKCAKHFENYPRENDGIIKLLSFMVSNFFERDARRAEGVYKICYYPKKILDKMLSYQGK